MKLLVDTHALMWWLEGSDDLSSSVGDLLEDPAVPVWVSVVSVWEIGIKARLKRLRLRHPDQWTTAGLDRRFGRLILPIELRHVVRAPMLPPIHQDPFDRMLVAQAIEDELTLVTRDRTLQKYPVECVW